MTNFVGIVWVFTTRNILTNGQVLPLRRSMCHGNKQRMLKYRHFFYFSLAPSRTCCVYEVTFVIFSGKNLVYAVLLWLFIFHDAIKRLYVWNNYRPVFMKALNARAPIEDLPSVTGSRSSFKVTSKRHWTKGARTLRNTQQLSWKDQPVSSLIDISLSCTVSRLPARSPRNLREILWSARSLLFSEAFWSALIGRQVLVSTVFTEYDVTV